MATLDELLAIDTGSDLAGPVGFTGRFLSLGGSLRALGVLGFALFVGGQSSLEAWTLNQLVRAAAGMTIMGAVVEALGLVLALSNVGDALVGSARFAVFLRVCGAAGFIVVTAPSRAPNMEAGRSARRHEALVGAASSALPTTGDSGSNRSDQKSLLGVSETFRAFGIQRDDSQDGSCHRSQRWHCLPIAQTSRIVLLVKLSWPSRVRLCCRLISMRPPISSSLLRLAASRK